MAKTKHQKLADLIHTFRSQLLEHEKELIERYGMPLPDCFRNEILTCWLLCNTPDELRNQQYEDFENQKGHREAHAIYYEQWQNPESELWGNLDQPAAGHFQAWSEKKQLMNHTYRKVKLGNYPYRPDEHETVLTNLSKTSHFIRSKPNRYQRDLVKSYYTHLVAAVFKNTGIQAPSSPIMEKSPAYGLTILRNFNCSLEPVYWWEQQKFLKLAPSRYPVSRQRARNVIEKITIEFLTNSGENLYWEKTLLALWTLLACASYRRRFCAVSDVFKVTFQDLERHKAGSSSWMNFNARYTLKINNESVPISGFFAHMLAAYSDQRRKEQPILSICRSTLEHHLKRINTSLGFLNDPVTPETFLECPHDFGADARYRPAN